jgi:hypothetical protein
MFRAETVACSLGDDRCYAFPHRLVDARASCSAQRAHRRGVLAASGGLRRHSSTITSLPHRD